MEYQNLSAKTQTNIGLFCSEINRQIYNDIRYTQLIEVIQEGQNINYALYGDTILLKENLFVPMFHTMYLANGINSVVLASEDDFWITDLFTNNIYYIIDQTDDNTKVYKNNIKTIKHIREIL
jgi:hypothetical protein